MTGIVQTLGNWLVSKRLGARVFACALGLAALTGAVTGQAQDAANAASSTKSAGTGAAATSIVWRGDHCTARAFVTDLVKQFQTQRRTRIAVTAFSTISGLDAVHDGSADFAGSARPAMPGREEEKGVNFYPVALDALVPITSPKNPVGNLSLKQLHDIYLGRITNWKDLGGENAPLNLYAVASPLDGVEFSLRLLLFGYGDQEVSAPRLYVNVEKLEEAITLDPHGLGISTLSGVYANGAVKMLTVEGFGASSTSIADATYPLYTTLYLATREDGKNRVAVDEFEHFVESSEAKTLLRKHQLVPYAEGSAVLARHDDHVAYLKAHIFAQPLAAPIAAAETPVSAPNATAQALTRMAPTSPSTQAAKERAARSNAEKAAKQKTSQIADGAQNSADH